MWSPRLLCWTHSHILRPYQRTWRCVHNQGRPVILYTLQMCSGHFIFARTQAHFTHNHTNTHTHAKVDWGGLEVSNLAIGDIYKRNAESLSIYLSHTHSHSPCLSKTMTCSPNSDPLCTSLLSDGFVTMCLWHRLTNTHKMNDKLNSDALFFPKNVSMQ